MKKLLVVGLIVAGLPLTAGADECIGTTLGWVDGQAQMGDLLVPENTTVRVELVSPYLWVYVGPEVSFEDTIASVESVMVPADATEFTACDSGVVEFGFPTAEPVEVVVPSPRFIEPAVFSIH